MTTFEQLKNQQEARFVEQYKEEMRNARYRDLQPEVNQLKCCAAIQLLYERGWVFHLISYKTLKGWWYHPKGAENGRRRRMTPTEPQGNEVVFYSGAYQAFRLYEALDDLGDLS